MAFMGIYGNFYGGIFSHFAIFLTFPYLII